MNKGTIILLKVLRKSYKAIFQSKTIARYGEEDANIASEVIRVALNSNKPQLIGRFGSTELACLQNYIGVKNDKFNAISYIRGIASAGWWEPKIIDQMKNWSGFFPSTIDNIEKFSQLYIKDISDIDILGSWLPDEETFAEQLVHCQKINLELLNPYFSNIPWTLALEGKKVLVVHPFSETIEQQYKKRKLIFKNNLLPEFTLVTIKAVQSIAGSPTVFKDWFQALNFMISEIDKVDYDICLIGCGAYGLPLAAHVKRMGKKGFHIGGSLQLLFGIRGNRWDDPNYNKTYNYSELINEHWVKASIVDRPANADLVEGACYW